MIASCAGMKRINIELRRTQNELMLPFLENFALFASFAVYDFFHRKERKGRKDRMIGLLAINHREHSERWQQIHPCLDLLENKPQINADERRFVNLDIQRLEVYPVECHVKPTKNSEISATAYEMAHLNQNNLKLSRQISAFICVHLRLIFVSLRYRARELQFRLFPVQENIELSNNNKAYPWLNLLKNKPQINADERRFVNLNIQRLNCLSLSERGAI